MDWRYNTIWFDQLDRSKVTKIDYKELMPKDFGDLEYVTLWRFKQPNQSLDELPISKTVQYLDLTPGGTKSLVGIGRLSSLHRLEIHHCTKLESDTGIAEVAGTLKFLHINTCRKFTIKGDLFSLRGRLKSPSGACADRCKLPKIRSASLQLESVRRQAGGLRYFKSDFLDAL